MKKEELELLCVFLFIYVGIRIMLEVANRYHKINSDWIKRQELKRIIKEIENESKKKIRQMC